MLPMVDPTLATQGIPTDGLDLYAAEPKLDGWRVTVGIEPGVVTIRTRRGRNTTAPAEDATSPTSSPSCVPFGTSSSARCSTASSSRTPDALATSTGSHPRSRHAGAGRLTVVVFDLLWLDGRLLIDETYEQRRAQLNDLELGPAITIVQSWDGMTAPYLFAACKEHGVEGIVLKGRTSTYRPGERSQEWRKIKTRHWFEKHAEHRRPR